MSDTRSGAPEWPGTTPLDSFTDRTGQGPAAGPGAPAKEYGAVRTCVPALPSLAEPADRDDYVCEVNIVRGLD